MPPVTRPPAELSIDAGLVHALVREQHPDLTHLPVRHVAGGWDNEILRLGSEYAVRLPRRRMAAALIEHEMRWLPELAPRLPLPIPAPLRRGIPGCGYPWTWAITRWLPGQTLAGATSPRTGINGPLGTDRDAHKPTETSSQNDTYNPTNTSSISDIDVSLIALDLGAFVAALGIPAPADAPRNPFRGVPLAQRDSRVTSGIEALADRAERERLGSMWTRALAAPAFDGEPVWLHGDLHPANLLVDDGQLSAVIDFGDVTSGDPATDLSVAWMLFDAEDRAHFRAAAGGCDEATWARARGNALAHGLACLSALADDPVIAVIGRRTIDLVLADDG